MAAPGVIHDRIEQDLVGVIQTLDLSNSTGRTGNIGTNVVVQHLLEKLHVTKWPAVLITAQGLSEEEGMFGEDGSFEEDYVTYPVLILICDQSRPSIQGPRPDYLLWRHQIAQKLRGMVNYPLLVNCPEVADIRVKNMPILPDGIAAKEFVQSGLVAQCATSELRVRSGNGS